MRPGPAWGISPTAPTATRRFRASTARTTSIGTARSWRRSARRSRLCNRAPAEERGRNARRRLSAGLRRAHAPRGEGGGAGAGRLGGAASRRLRGRVVRARAARAARPSAARAGPPADARPARRRRLPPTRRAGGAGRRAPPGRALLDAVRGARGGGGPRGSWFLGVRQRGNPVGLFRPAPPYGG